MRRWPGSDVPIAARPAGGAADTLLDDAMEELAGDVASAGFRDSGERRRVEARRQLSMSRNQRNSRL